MNEQETTDKFEAIVGSVTRCFRLMNIWIDAKQRASGHASSNGLPFHKVSNQLAEDIFRKKAQAERYTTEQINFYLENIA